MLPSEPYLYPVLCVDGVKCRRQFFVDDDANAVKIFFDRRNRCRRQLFACFLRQALSVNYFLQGENIYKNSSIADSNGAFSLKKKSYESYSM